MTNNKNKYLVPDAIVTVDDLKMEMTQDIGYFCPGNQLCDAMHPTLINGLAVSEMVKKGEEILNRTDLLKLCK